MKIIPPMGTPDQDGVVTHTLNSNGHELVDDTPMSPPIGYRPTPSMIDHIRNMVRSELLRREAEEAGFETFEEADDFEVGDDYDPSSPYEETFEPPIPPSPPEQVPATPAPPAPAPGVTGSPPSPAPQTT